MHSPLGPALPDHFTDPSWYRTARMATRWLLPAEVAVIAASGEIDAANTEDFVDYTLRQATRSPHIILDLTGIDFFGTAGFSALHTLNQSCRAQDVDLTVVAGSAVLRLRPICDPDSALQVTQNVAAAQRRVRLLELIPESR